MKPNDIAAARPIPHSFAGGGFRDPIWPSSEFVVTKRPRAIVLDNLHEIEAAQSAAAVAEPDEGFDSQHEGGAACPAEDEPAHLSCPRYMIAGSADQRAWKCHQTPYQDEQLTKAGPHAATAVGRKQMWLTKLWLIFPGASSGMPNRSAYSEREVWGLWLQDCRHGLRKLPSTMSEMGKFTSAWGNSASPCRSMCFLKDASAARRQSRNGKSNNSTDPRGLFRSPAPDIRQQPGGLRRSLGSDQPRPPVHRLTVQCRAQAAQSRSRLSRPHEGGLCSCRA